MTGKALHLGSRAPAPSTAGETLFGSFVQARERVPAGRRALAGLRHGEEWAELTYAELMHDVENVSTHLSELGLDAGDVLCMQLPNWTEAVIYTYAAARLGAVACPITTIYRQRELQFILQRTDCKILVAPATYRGFDYAAMLGELVESLPALRHVICVGNTEAEGVVSSRHLLQTSADLVVPAHSADPADIAVLAFTSGTTGESKGVMHSHASMHAAIDDFVAHAGFGSGLTSLVVSPFGHLTGFTWGILMPLRGAGDVVLLESWEPRRAMDLIERYSVNFTMGATPFLSDLLEAAGDGTGHETFPEVFVCAGAPIPPSLVRRAVEVHDSRIVSGWGMSEYPIGTATAKSDDPVLASTTDGRPAGAADVRVVDPTGTPVAVGEEGDVIIRGPGLFKGYYKRPDLDADSLTEDGYLKTGDRARVLDARGHMRITGRTKDIIIRGGENIPVVEIENILLTHPAIKEIALVPLPHDRLGEIACACVVLNQESPPVTIDEMGRFLGEHGVAKQFYPEGVKLLSGLPRTPSGKIQKFALRELVIPPSDAQVR